jgi:alkaline phosphatase D
MRNGWRIQPLRFDPGAQMVRLGGMHEEMQRPPCADAAAGAADKLTRGYGRRWSRSLARLLLPALALLPLTAAADDAEPDLTDPQGLVTHGPIVGHVDHKTVRVWARFARAGVFRLVLFDADMKYAGNVAREAKAENDYCVTFEADWLYTGRTYHYGISDEEQIFLIDDGLTFRTAPGPDEPSDISIAFGSCAHDRRFPAQPVWTRIVESEARLFISLGDTPYIDSTDLEVQRRRYREFYSVPEIRAALRRLPYIGTWDDHDFGKNNVDGNLPGKENARQAFIEYHANPSYGDGQKEGVYTSFRYGPVEVFLLDTRWFAATESSPFDNTKPTLLGRKQWAWLLGALRASTAPFKLIACGMIWNGAVRPDKPDHWMSYPHERAALFRYIGQHRIPGVVLIGGDIHRSRAIRHPSSELAGYDLYEFITSPLANRVIAAADVPIDGLLHDVGEEQTFLLLSVDTVGPDGLLRADCIDHAGKVHFTVDLHASDLRAPPAQ